MKIKSSLKDYQLSFIESFKDKFNSVYQPGDFVIIDRNVYNTLDDSIFSTHMDTLILVDATESQKSYLNLAPIINTLIESGFKKNNRLIAIGGGITQDITAFIASIMYRGVDWIFFPTTLLAQCDSCIGSKTSINFGKYKNQIGNFYSPKEIFVDTNFLQTLSERDIVSGLGEMAHYYLVAGEDEFKFYKANYLLAKNDMEILGELIRRSLQIKKSYIEIDEFDQNERQVFNYGHSFGHAIESLTKYEIPHGVAVSIGMDMSNYFSTKLGYMSIEDRERIRIVLQEIWSGYSIENIVQTDMENALKRDKKNKGDYLGLILSRGPGKTFKDFQKLNEEFSGWLSHYFKYEFVK